MKRWLLAGALAVAAAGQAFASDLPPPAAPVPPRAPAAYVPPVSPVYNWGGIYFGFNLGYGFGTSGVCNQGAQCGFPAPGLASNDTVKFSTSVIRFGLDYKFR